MSQNEAEFIPDDCSEYKTPIIKADRVRSLAGAGAEGNTDDCDPGDQATERLRLLDEDPGDTGTESGTGNILREKSLRMFLRRTKYFLGKIFTDGVRHVLQRGRSLQQGSAVLQ